MMIKHIFYLIRLFVSDRVYFIDYEYAMLNCEHYETAHHFCYMAGKLNYGSLAILSSTKGRILFKQVL